MHFVFAGLWSAMRRSLGGGPSVCARAHTHLHTGTGIMIYHGSLIHIYIYLYACLTVSKSVPVAGSEDLVFFNVFATIHFWNFLGVPKFQYHVCVFGSELYTTILVLFATYWKPQWFWVCGFKYYHKHHQILIKIILSSILEATILVAYW